MNEPLLFSNIVLNPQQRDFWNDVRSQSGTGGQFMVDLARKYNPNRFVARDGEWSLPWTQEIPDVYKLPTYDATFAKSFAEVTDNRAREIKQLINEKNQKFAIMYSGGIDSTLALSALIKNLTVEELKNVVVCANSQSIVENPTFWSKFIWNKFKIINSTVTKYDDLIEAGYRPITADEGDCLFGMLFGLDLYQHYDHYCSMVSESSRADLQNLKKDFNTAHYSKFKDIILKHFEIHQVKRGGIHDFHVDTNPNFAELWYQKIVKNIETSLTPVHTLHDFFWWQIFNLKYVNCAMRCAIYLNDRIDVKTVVNDWAINWFNSSDYQHWSMTNNNNGEKIQTIGAATYKMASRNYIYELDKNDWYYYFKLKIGSLGASVMLFQDLSSITAGQQPNFRFGLDHEYNIMYITDQKVKDFIAEKMSAYTIDW